MNIHEYQAKKIFAKYGVNTLKGHLVCSKDELKRAYEELNAPVCVLKAQVHAGGRGKAGGVKVVKSLDEAVTMFDNVFDKRLVTHQTGKDGELVTKMYLEDGCNIVSENYLSFVLNRKEGMVSIIASSEGGMDIEAVAEETPEKVVTVNVDPVVGISEYIVRKLFFVLGFEKELYKEFSKLIKALYQIYIDYDANLIEINPLVIDDNNNIIALDAKMSFDDNALFRQPEIEEMRDNSSVDPNELEAAKYGLSYVALDGDIGCLVNGAGLAMATMDAVKFSGGNPSNFLDIGGGADEKIIAHAISLIFDAENVRGVLVNIFGGINHCDVIARGVVMALKNSTKKLPIVIRLQGMNYEEGKKIIEESGFPIYLTDSMDEGSDLIVKLSKEVL